MYTSKVWNLLKDLSDKDGITEIMLNDYDSVLVERNNKFIKLKSDFVKEDIVIFVKEVAKLNKRPCNYDNPILDGMLEDGSRINVIIPPYSGRCPAITIRKYKDILSFDGGKELFSLNKKWKSFVKSLVKARFNIIISGGTGVGKTTLMNLLLNEVSDDERIIILEDTKEIKITHPNTVRIESNVGASYKNPLKLRDLLKNILRMRPDRIILGETRGEEMFDFVQAMNTGHNGSICTIHANSIRDTLSRIETLMMTANSDMPLLALRKQMSSAIDFIIQVNKTKKGERIVEQVSEVTSMEGENILTLDICNYSQDSERLAGIGLTPTYIERLVEAGLPANFFESE